MIYTKKFQGTHTRQTILPRPCPAGTYSFNLSFNETSASVACSVQANSTGPPSWTSISIAWASTRTYASSVFIVIYDTKGAQWINKSRRPELLEIYLLFIMPATLTGVSFLGRHGRSQGLLFRICILQKPRNKKGRISTTGKLYYKHTYLPTCHCGWGVGWWGERFWFCCFWCRINNFTI